MHNPSFRLYKKLLALHLLKFVDFFNEQGLGRYGLFYLRNLEKQEVDFLITKDHQPYLMIESKASNKNISKSLLDFSDQLKPKYSFHHRKTRISISSKIEFPYTGRFEIEQA